MSPDSSPVSSGNSSRVAISTAGDGYEYSEEELQFIWDTVVRAEATLPQLPPTSRHPTNALFRAYEDLLEERDVEPTNGPKLDKLLFKIGGSRDGNTIAEKFQAVMARMNITVRLDIDEATEDGFSYRSDQSYESDHSDLLDQPEYLDHPDHPDHPDHQDLLDHRDHLDPQGHPDQTDYHSDHLDRLGYSEGPVQPRHFIHSDHGSAKETVLEKSAAAFERHRDKIHALQALQKWQDRSSALKNQTQLFTDARLEDLKAQSRDVLVAWNEIAVEVDEMPLDDLPANVYSKRIEKIATRTHEIKSTKNALAEWKRAEQQRQQREEEEDLFKDDPRLSRLAQRTHENLSKSRAISFWSNRAAEEEEKAEVARRAHEMSLKAKAFGRRPKPQIFAALRQRLEEKSAATTNQIDDPFEQPNLERPRPDLVCQPLPPLAAASAAGHLHDLDAPYEASHQPSKMDNLPEDLHRSNKLDAPRQHVLHRPIKPTGPQEVSSGHGKVPPDDPVEEMDERTLLAKRHMTRRRVFNAWEEYTQEHRSKVEAFTTQKVIEPWREKSCRVTEKAIDGAQQHVHRSDRDVLAEWHRSEGRQKELETMAINFHRKTRMGKTLASWRDAAHKEETKEQQLENMAKLGDQYRKMHGTVQTWKARARERAVYTSMKDDVLKTWREESKDEQARVEHLEYMSRRVNLYRIKQKALPSWRQAAKNAAERERKLQTYSERAEFYSLTTEAINTWRAASKEKRKARLRESYLEVRRRVKKAMGARCVARWHENSEARREHMHIAAEEFTRYRDLNATARTFDTWRLRAREKEEAEAIRQAEAEQNRMNEWRMRNDSRQQLQAEAEEHFQDKVMSRVVKEWKLGSLQLESRRNASQKHLNRERKQLRQGFEAWYAKAAAKAQRAPAKTRAAAVEEETEFPSTPGRPRLFAGPPMQTTTPLAPVPQRQPWQGLEGGGGPTDSLLARPLPGGTASRSGRPRRNLRVSWAD
ncbi:putative Sfi1 spindle body domain-containing protein [Seiridium unicorne]|uniref:Sfi1 spindle body domain-containing protein n=1 Tax=Seiridium unicorne TaxID=138068 RepID=A0ABR2VHE0_9PEZI